MKACLIAVFNSNVNVPQTGSASDRQRSRLTEGPGTWDEVDTEEIERVAVGIARNAMPSNIDNTELASRLAAQVQGLSAGCFQSCACRLKLTERCRK